MKKITEEQVMLWVGNEGYGQKQRKKIIGRITTMRSNNMTTQLFKPYFKKQEEVSMNEILKETFLMAGIIFLTTIIILFL